MNMKERIAFIDFFVIKDYQHFVSFTRKCILEEWTNFYPWKHETSLKILLRRILRILILTQHKIAYKLN